MTISETTSSYDKLITTLRETALLGSAASVLHWDEQTYMPPGGGELRADQVSLIARLCHQRVTSPEFTELLDAAEAELAAEGPGAADSDMAVNLREIRRDHDRQSRLPAELVEELSRTSSLSEQVWAQARRDNSFADFQPWLEKIIALKQREAQCVGSPTGDLYDALLDEYEPGMTAAQLRTVFDELRDPLADLVSAVAASDRTPPTEILSRRYPVDAQERLSRRAAEAVGFDFNQGRLDISVHPFCSMIGPGDTRMTTRYQENYIGDAFFSVLHETGHGLYDQGVPREHFGTPLGDFVSLGIHESQSRMWENLVGRSEPFWQWMWPQFQAEFGDPLSGVTLEQWLAAVNVIEPSLIRTESDEVTYNLHIILRFELEQALLSGDLKPADLPGEWNSAMKRLVGVVPDTDADGCLQDVHWSGGAIGYFPTYTLGNLMAAQLFDAATSAIPGLDEKFAAGDFSPLLGWLRENIHRHGQRYSSAELIRRATGSDLTAKPLLDHLRRKATRYYGVA